MNTHNETATGYAADARAEIQELRAKVEALMQNRVTPALSALACEAQAAAQAASLAWMFEHATVFDANGAGETGESHAAARMLAEAHEAVAVVALQAAALAENEDDQTTHAMLMGRVSTHETAARLLRSHLD